MKWIADAYNDPYSEKRDNAIKRAQFVKLKNTQAFKAWRTRQLKIQQNKCAWCEVKLRPHIKQHIDHVTPLRFEGTNEYSNLVVSCARCNYKKWIANNRVYPQWIKDNDKAQRQRQRTMDFRRRQYQQAQEILDDQIMDSLRWI